MSYFLVSPPVSGQSYDDTYVSSYNIDEATVTPIHIMLLELTQVHQIIGIGWKMEKPSHLPQVLDIT